MDIIACENPTKINDITFRQAEIDARDRELAEKKAEEQKKRDRQNKDFFMIFKHPSAIGSIQNLIGKSPIAAKLLFFIAQHAGKDNCFVASQTALAEALDVSGPSISRAVTVLEDSKLVKRFRAAGSFIFALNPDVIWSSWSNGKDYCLFHSAKVLISKSEQDPDFGKVTSKNMRVAIKKTKRQKEPNEANLASMTYVESKVNWGSKQNEQ